MADFTVRYSDFKGGDWGVRDPAKADADTFSGVNVYPYESGLLGVRAGFKQVAITGLPNHPIVPGPLGFWAHGLTGDLIVFLNKPYAIPNGGGAATAWTAYPDNPTPTSPVRFLVGGGTVYSLCNGKLYKHATPASTTAITTPAPLSYIVRWGYYFVGVDMNIPWRIWFSTVDAAGAHFETWGANDFLDIGATGAITAIKTIRNVLYVGKRAGWNAVTGVLGTLASVRLVIFGNGPIDPRLIVNTTDNRLLYWPVEPRPAWFNGMRVYRETVITPPGQDVGVTPLPFTGDSVIATPTGRRMLMARNVTAGTEIRSWAAQAWTRHLFAAKLGGLVPGDVADGYQLPADVVYAVLAPTTVGDPVVVGSYQHELDRPGHVTDTFSAPSDVGSTTMVTGTVDFPSYWEPIGRQVRVRGLVVQFRKWPSGVAGALNQIQVRVDPHGAYGSGPHTGTTMTWDEPCERASTGGSDDSWRVGIGDQGFGNGFQVHFTKLVGVALREVIVLVDVRTDRV